MIDVGERLVLDGERFRARHVDVARVDCRTIQTGRRRPRVTVAAVAAATVAVVAGATVASLALRDAGSGDDRPSTAASPPDPTHSGQDPEFAVAAPQLAELYGGGRTPRFRPCRLVDVTAQGEVRLAAGGVVGVLRLRGDGGYCSLRLGDGPLVLLDRQGHALEVRTAAPPTVNPGRSDGSDVLLTTTGVTDLGLAWRGSWCGPAVGAVRVPLAPVRGRAVSSLVVPLTGPTPPCRGRSDSVVVRGVVGGPGAPVQTPPPAWSALRARLLLPSSTDGRTLTGIRVRLTNPTAAPIDLSPCPAYALRYTVSDNRRGINVSGDGSRGCATMQSIVPAGGSVLLPVPPVTFHLGPYHALKGSRVKVDWAIAGVPTAMGYVRVR